MEDRKILAVFIDFENLALGFKGRTQRFDTARVDTASAVAEPTVAARDDGISAHPVDRIGTESRGVRLAVSCCATSSRASPAAAGWPSCW